MSVVAILMLLMVADCTMYMQVIAMRLNVKLSPDQERQLLESSMVPLTNEEDHILVIETASAMPAPAAVQQLMQPPANLASPGPGNCSGVTWQSALLNILHSSTAAESVLLHCCLFVKRMMELMLGCAGGSSSRGMRAAALSGKLVIPEWAGPTGSRSSAGLKGESALLQRATSTPAGPHGYQPEFLDKQTAGVKQQSSASISRRNSSAALLLTAASGAADSEGAGSVSRPGFPISLQASSSLLVPGGSLYKQSAVLSGGRTRRPSLLGLPSMHVSLHALPENNAYLGPPRARSPRRTSSFLTSSGTVTRKGSLDHETSNDPSMPLVDMTAQSDVMDASLLEPEILDNTTDQPLEVSRRSTSLENCEVASCVSTVGGTGLMGAVPPVQVSYCMLVKCLSEHESCHRQGCVYPSCVF